MLPRPIYIFSVLSLVFSGCGKEEIKVYSVPKEKPVASSAASSQPDAATPPEASPVHWKTPATWEELAPTSLRVGNFRVSKGEKKAEVSILRFPGKVGTELDNVNRWRGEIGLAPVSENEVSSEKVQIGSDEGKFYNFAGAQAQTLATVLEKDGTSWFIKMRGDKEVVSQDQSTFLEFLKSIHFDSGEHSEPAAVAEKSESRSPQSAPETAPGDPKWEIPSTWTEKQPSAMVLKSFSVTDKKGGQATVSISAFPGDVGGQLANVNRWRGQLGLDPVEASGLSKAATSIDVLGGKATLVDVNGTDAKTGKSARMIAAMVSRGGKTWFYKLLGDESAADQEKDSFIKFVQTVSYPND